MIDKKLQEQLDRSCTVEELHQYLGQLIENDQGSSKIMIGQPTHDHWRTKIAQPIIIGHINPGNIKYTSYHSAAQITNDDNYDEIDNDRDEEVQEIEVVEVILFNHY